jgi:cytochrome b involved in lipid metabolism
MKFFTFALLAILMIGIAVPVEQAFARRSDDSQQGDSRSGYDDSDDDDEYEDEDEDEDDDSDDSDDGDEYEDDDSDDDSYTPKSSSTRPISSMTNEERLSLLQDLLARIVALMNELKNMTSNTTTTPAPTTPAKTYTAADVATHNTTASCWSIINSKVYDLTSYISRHPGGSRNIMRICGVDGTSAFTGQHGGDSKPERTLAGFYLAPLAR